MKLLLLLNKIPLSIRLLINGIAFFALLFIINIHTIPKSIHATIGTSLFAFFAIHILWHPQWFQSLLKGPYRPLRRVSLFTNIALATSGIITVIESTRPAIFFTRATDKLAHATAGYWMLIFIGIHIGLHVPLILSEIKRRLPKLYNSCQQYHVTQFVFSLITVYGVYAFFNLNLHQHLFFIPEADVNFAFLSSNTSFTNILLALSSSIPDILNYFAVEVALIYITYRITKLLR